MSDHPDNDFLFSLFELQRLVRHYADREAARHGTTRAQWAVLAKLARSEGLKQAELADLMDIHPMSLTRLVDRLCRSGLIERRADPGDRRANRLYLLPAAQPLMRDLAERRSEILRGMMNGLSATETKQLMTSLDTIRDNVRTAIQTNPSCDQMKESLNG